MRFQLNAQCVAQHLHIALNNRGYRKNGYVVSVAMCLVSGFEQMIHLFREPKENHV